MDTRILEIFFHCLQCSLHCIAERVMHTAIKNPVFADSCNNEKVNFCLDIDSLQHLQDVLESCGSNTTHFMSNTRG